MKTSPPIRALKFLRWFCRAECIEEIEGDLTEIFIKEHKALPRKAKWMFTWRVLKCFRPEFIRPLKYHRPNSSGMYKSHFKIGWRNLTRNWGYSLINIGGLAVGMGVAILIGLWIWNELSFNKNFENYGRIAQVWQFVKFDVEKTSYNVVPIPLAEELRTQYPEFESVTPSASREAILSTDAKKFLKTGKYVEPVFLDMMSVDIVAGSASAMKDINSILLSESLAVNFFGSGDPLGKTLTINNNQSLTVGAVYRDFPDNSTFKDTYFIAPWEFCITNDPDAIRSKDQWDSNSYQIYAQLKAGADVDDVSMKIRDIRMKRDNPPAYKPEFFLHPMSKWHLYADFKDGKNTGGLIEYVWLFGAIGVLVLILACINFMNLATARSEKRAKEVGIRKSIGSLRSQLIVQFLTESFLIVCIGFIVSLLLVQLALPSFNGVAGKSIGILWTNPLFWALGIAFSVITGVLAGCYPALYLSSFLPVKVLKGTYRAGRFASLPRKFLVVLQFTVSITLMIGIAVIYRQVDFAKNRHVGYNRSGLIEMHIFEPSLRKRLDVLRNELIKSGAVEEMSASTGSVTTQAGGTVNFFWEGKSDGTQPLFMSNYVTHEYGKTVGWEIMSGRDFSRDIAADNTSMIVNEAAVRLMGVANPLETVVTHGDEQYRIIGIIKDMIKESPFEPIKPTFYLVNNYLVNTINVKLAPQIRTHDAIEKVEEVMKTFNPESPFDYKFVDSEYARKFSVEERIGKLAGFFAILAILISSLGVFGLASFVAEKRTKEVGIRKVLGASAFNIWRMLSNDFVLLVSISFALAVPIGYYYMSNWLIRFDYRTEIAWWIFAASGACTMAITLVTVSFQAIKAAVMNPVKSLRSE